jgi:hypothetical protein
MHKALGVAPRIVVKVTAHDDNIPREAGLKIKDGLAKKIQVRRQRFGVERNIHVDKQNPWL